MYRYLPCCRGLPAALPLFFFNLLWYYGPTSDVPSRPSFQPPLLGGGRSGVPSGPVRHAPWKKSAAASLGESLGITKSLDARVVVLFLFFSFPPGLGGGDVIARALLL